MQFTFSTYCNFLEPFLQSKLIFREAEMWQTALCAIFQKVLLCALDLNTNLAPTVIQIVAEQYLRNNFTFFFQKKKNICEVFIYF